MKFSAICITASMSRYHIPHPRVQFGQDIRQKFQIKNAEMSFNLRHELHCKTITMDTWKTIQKACAAC